MKISNMTNKTSLEISDNDVFIIEDNQDTKKVTAAELREYIFRDKRVVRSIVNNALERVAAAILDARYLMTHRYMTNTWIGSASGNVQIAVKDLDTDKWLTASDLFELLNPVDEVATREYTIKVFTNDIYHTAVSYTIRDFNIEHEDAINVNEVLSTSNAGFIKAHFDGLTQNEISAIKFNDIFLTLEETDNEVHTFVPDENSFANSVPFVEEV